MASETKTGFKVCCPECGQEDVAITLDLTDLASVWCSNCEAEFSPEDAVKSLQEKAAEWERVVRWIEAAKGWTTTN